MIETRRPAPTRILKQRDVQAGAAVPATPASFDGAAAKSKPAPSAPVLARCVAKEARLVAVDGGTTAVEVRCSCGEWTRVELQIGELPETKR